MSKENPFLSDWFKDLTQEEKKILRAKKKHFQRYLSDFIDQPYENLCFLPFSIPHRWPKLIGGQEAFLLSVIIGYTNGAGFLFYRKGELEKLSGLSTGILRKTLISLVKQKMIARCTYDLLGYQERIKHLVPFNCASWYFEKVLRFAPDYLEACRNFYKAFEYPVIERDIDTLQVKVPPIDLARE